VTSRRHRGCGCSARINVPRPRSGAARNGTHFTGVVHSTGDRIAAAVPAGGSSAVQLGDLAPGAALAVDEPDRHDLRHDVDQIAGLQSYGGNSRDAYRRRSLAAAALVPSGVPYCYGSVRSAHAY
jgi:hypothetical protein